MFEAQAIQDLLSIIFLIAGLFFVFVGAIGIYRMPDAYHRLHTASKCSTLGAVGLVLAVAFHIGSLALIAKATMVLVFMFIAMPVGSHILARAAQQVGARQWRHTHIDEFAEDNPDAPVPPKA